MRKSNIKRNFVCGCGKDYLSLSNLYEHMVRKHNGIIIPNTKTISKQIGRPKNTFIRLAVNSNYLLYRKRKNLKHPVVQKTIKRIKINNEVKEVED